MHYAVFIGGDKGDIGTPVEKLVIKILKKGEGIYLYC